MHVILNGTKSFLHYYFRLHQNFYSMSGFDMVNISSCSMCVLLQNNFLFWMKYKHEKTQNSYFETNVLYSEFQGKA